MESSQRRNWWGVARVFQFLKVLPPACFISIAAHAAPFDCSSDACGLPGDGPFSNLVVGTVKRVANDADARTVFHWARKHGYWAALAEDAQRFPHTIQMMSVEVPGARGPREITLLMGRGHYDAIRIVAGDLVRYTPRRPGNAAPDSKDPGADAYRKLFGCIAVLCRAEDRSCPARYTAGVYRLGDGVQLGADLGTPLAGGVQVDTGTYLPIRPIGQ